MSSYPIVEERPLGEAPHGGPWGLGPRKRAAADIPQASAHQILVFKANGIFVVDNRRSRRDDEHVRGATSVTVIDVRVNAPVLAQLRIPAAGGAEFTVQVTFWCTVRKPEDVAAAGVQNLEDQLVQYVKQHQPLFHVGEELELDEVSQARVHVDAAIRAYATHRPPDFPGLDVLVGSVEVLTPDEYKAFEQTRRDKQREAQLSSEEQRRQAALEQESADLKQVMAAKQQTFEQQLAAQAAANKQLLDQMQQQYEDVITKMRMQTTHDVQASQARHEQTLETESHNHQLGLQDATIGHAIDSAARIGNAIGAEQSDMLNLIAIATGERTADEVATRKAAERELQRQAADEREEREALRQREDEREQRVLAREEKLWRREDDHLAADRDLKFKVAVLEAYAEAYGDSVGRGVFDRQGAEQALDKIVGVLKGATATGIAPQEGAEAVGPGSDAAGDQLPTADRVLKGDVVTESYDTSPRVGAPAAEPLMEEDL
jgi:hypothetical protein